MADLVACLPPVPGSDPGTHFWKSEPWIWSVDLWNGLECSGCIAMWILFFVFTNDNNNHEKFCSCLATSKIQAKLMWVIAAAKTKQDSSLFL
jgi:hypothetical protein